MPDESSKIIAVNVVAFNYSGSTWLNLMLGSHSLGFNVGEMKVIDKVGKPVCAFDLHDCPIWTRYDPDSGENPFLQIARITGKRVLAASKNNRYFRHLDHPAIEPKFIHLVRDGRAVTASMLRKGRTASMGSAAREWVHDVKRHRRLLRRQGGGEALTVVYERLQADPPGGLREICRFLGIGYEPDMLSYWRQAHHPLGGNRGTLLAMARRSGIVLPDQVPEGPNVAPGTPVWDRDWEHYERTDPAKFTDERWKHELTDRQLRVFGLIAGRLNRKLGYPRSLDRGE